MELSNPQHEAFAQQVAGGCSLSEAARRSGYSAPAAPNAGSRLMQRQDVQQRVVEIQEEAGPTPEPGTLAAVVHPFTTKPFIIQEVVGIHRLAKKAGDFGVSVQCLRTLAQLGGHLYDGCGRQVALSEQNKSLNALMLSAAQLNELLKRGLSGSKPQLRAQLLDAVPELAELTVAEETQSTSDNE